MTSLPTWLCRSSRHHWKRWTSCTGWPLELSIGWVSFLPGKLWISPAVQQIRIFRVRIVSLISELWLYFLRNLTFSENAEINLGTHFLCVCGPSASLYETGESSGTLQVNMEYIRCDTGVYLRVVHKYCILYLCTTELLTTSLLNPETPSRGCMFILSSLSLPSGLVSSGW